MPDLSSEKIEKKCTSSDGSTCAISDPKSISLGGGDMEVVIDSEGISVDGRDLIKETSSGEVHIGENSLVTKEESNTQKLWGTDSSGNKIPINIVDSELQIDGTGVQSQITSNATNITSNDTDIATNASNISSNDTDIATNASNISSNDTDNAPLAMHK